MKALIKEKPERGARLTDLPKPSVGDDDILVEVKATAICGTDIHIYSWNEFAASRIKPPFLFGHEYAGTVVEVGRNVGHIEVGDRVAAETHVACGHCLQCTTGLEHVCRDMKILGVHIPGSFAEYCLMPASCAWKLDPAIPFSTGAIMEPLAIGVHAMSKTKPAGRKVVVFGCGPIGIYTQMVAALSGAEFVIGVDISEYRLELAKTMGVDYAFNPQKTDLVAEVMKLTDGYGADIVVELTGAEPSADLAGACLRRGGELVLCGLFSGPVQMDLVTNVIYKEATVYGVTGRVMWDSWWIAQNMLLSGKLKPEPVTTHTFGLDQYQEAFELALSGKSGKIVFEL